MSTPAAKRRRIDTASQTLSKPFRSPFKTPFKSPANPQNASASSSTSSSTPNAAILSAENTTPLALKTTNTLLSRAPFHKPATPRPSAKEKASSPIVTARINADPEVVRFLKEQRELERQLRGLKDELDMAEQAGKIEKESREWATKRAGEGLGGHLEIDGELVVLIGKWREASRAAAEELFGRVRDRVNRMGGPRAWKEAQMKRQEYQNSWDQEEPTNNKDDDDEEIEGKDVEKRDLYADYDIDPETENEKSQRAKGLGDTGELPGQEDEFTMAMMLRTLNVDLDIVGYDKQQQRWED